MLVFSGVTVTFDVIADGVLEIQHWATLSATHFALSAALSVLTILVGIYCYTLWPFLFLKLLKILNNIMFTYFIYFSLFWSSLF